MFSLPLKIEQTIVIEKTIMDVWQIIADFKHWPQWSPWLIQEPNCQYTVTGEIGSAGHSQRWEGNFIGSGTMHIITAHAPTMNKSNTGKKGEIQYDLNFLKPWKSQSKVAFEIHEEGGSTHVRWTMDGSIPFFFLPMKKMMTAYISNDYRRGLAMLKELVEKGSVPSRVNVAGVKPQPGFLWIGKRSKCPIRSLGESMHRDFMEFQKADSIFAQVGPPSQVFAFTHVYDMIRGFCEYTAAVSYDEPTNAKIQSIIAKSGLPKGFASGSVPAHQALVVEHHGTYDHLGNAWATAIGRQRSMRLKSNKTVAAYEIYRTMPGSVPNSEILTQVTLPVR